MSLKLGSKPDQLIHGAKLFLSQADNGPPLQDNAKARVFSARQKYNRRNRLEGLSILSFLSLPQNESLPEMKETKSCQSGALTRVCQLLAMPKKNPVK